MLCPVTFLLIRHGETAWNLDGRIQGHGDSPLAATGLAQARALAERLARDKVHALYSSDLGRACETARYVAEATARDIRFDSGLRERSYGILEGKTWSQVERDHPDDYARQLALDPEHAMHGGESTTQFRDRVLRTLDRIARESDGERIAVVTHGGVLGILYREAMGIPLSAPRSYTVFNASINRFRYVARGWEVEQWGDTDHLEKAASLDDVQ